MSSADRAGTVTEFVPKVAARLNSELPINPPVSLFGTTNAILTGTSRTYFVPDFAGPSSLKATLRGTASWKVDERVRRVSESTYLLVNAGQPYTISYDEPSDVTTFVLLFRDGFLEEIAAGMRLGLNSSLDDPFHTDSLELPTALHAGPSAVLQKLRTFAEQLARRSLGTELWDLHFHQLAVTLVREIRSNRPQSSDISATKASTRQELLRRVSIGRDFLVSMSDQPVTVEDAARAACISIFHFHRVFVEAFGISPHLFLRDFRLQRAANMLRLADDPVTEIVAKVGFKSVSSFSSAFCKQFGLPPKLFRTRSRS